MFGLVSLEREELTFTTQIDESILHGCRKSVSIRFTMTICYHENNPPKEEELQNFVTNAEHFPFFMSE